MAILSFCSVTKNAPVKKNFTGAPPVHRWCGEIVKYLTLLGTAARLIANAEMKIVSYGKGG